MVTNIHTTMIMLERNVLIKGRELEIAGIRLELFSEDHEGA